MKRRSITIGALTAIMIGVAVALSAGGKHTLGRNPDPNHTHADFAVWVGGVHLDFTDPQYMAKELTPAEEAALKASGALTDKSRAVLQKYLHLHDGNGRVLHRHKPGLTLGDFFASIGFPAADQCMTLDDLQYGRLDAGWKKDFAITKSVCTNGKFHWAMYVNGVERPVDFGYVFADGDHILLTYDAADGHGEQLKQMTDDACLYSRTCPWRGKAPTEHCIADPNVPCTQ